MLLTLTLASALAGEPALVPALGTPSTAARRAVSVQVVWAGGPADVLVGAPGAGVVRYPAATSPLDLGRLRPGERVRVQRGEEVVGELDGTLIWTPADVAAWSGPGLRGATVTALAPATNGLWAATDGGLALWDGAVWRHLGRRQGLTTVTDVSIAEGTRWIVDGDDVVRLDPEGRALRFDLGDHLQDGDGVGGVRAVTADAALVLTRRGVLALGVAADGVPRSVALVEDGPCEGLFGPPGALVARCRRLWTDLDPGCAVDPSTPCATPTQARSLPEETVAVVPAADGPLIATPDGLLRVGDRALEDAWRVPDGHVVDAVPLGRGLLVSTFDRAWHVRDGVGTALGAARGVPGRSFRATALAPGPTPGKAWLGTDRGVALVTEADTATPLPLAPLAAGVAIDAVASDGEATLVATTEGLAWLGRPPPGAGALRAAVTGPVLRVAAVGRDWWVLVAGHAWRLDRKGELSRWDLDGEGVDLASLGDAVVLATTDGLRWWLPGASMLGPLDPVPGLRAIVPAADGALWVLVDDEVRRLDRRGTPQTWSVPGARALVATGPGAIAAGDEGVVWLTPGTDEPVVPDEVRLDGVVDLAVRDGHLWTLADDGTVARDGRPLAVVRAPRRLALDRAGAWIATGAGLWRIVPTP